MPARVPEGAGIGYLGPVDDPAAMARLVEKAWSEDVAAMSARARQHVGVFSGDVVRLGEVGRQVEEVPLIVVVCATSLEQALLFG